MFQLFYFLLHCPFGKRRIKCRLFWFIMALNYAKVQNDWFNTWSKLDLAELWKRTMKFDKDKL